MPGCRRATPRRAPPPRPSWRRRSTRWRSPALPRSLTETDTPAARAAAIRARAGQEGFDAVGFTTPDRHGPDIAERRDAFMALGSPGEMRSLGAKAERHRHPNQTEE